MSDVFKATKNKTTVKTKTANSDIYKSTPYKQITQKYLDNQSENIISSADLNDDNSIDILDLIKAKKITEASPSSIIKQINSEATQNIRDYFFTPSYDYQSAVNNSIEKMKNNTLTAKGYQELADLLSKAKIDNRISEKERKNYGELYKNLEIEIKYYTSDLSVLEKEIDELQKKKDESYKKALEITQLETEINADENRLISFGRHDLNYFKLKKQIDDNKAKLNSLKENYQKNFEGFESIEKKLTENKAFYNIAKRKQEAEKLSGVGNIESEYYDKDFEKYVAIGKKEYESKHKRSSEITHADLPAINYDQKGYYADVAEKMKEYSEKLYSFNYINMTERERNIYLYYLGRAKAEAKGGEIDETTAEKYLKAIEYAINSRYGEKLAAKLKEDGLLAQYLFAQYVGLENFSTGISNNFSKEDYITPSATQFASARVREDLADKGPKVFGSSLGQIGYDLITTTSNMLPSILTSTVIGIINPVAGDVVGAGLMGTSASGNAYQEMLNLGYDKDQARTYSVLVGASEAALSYALGGISKLGGKVSGNIISKAISGIGNGIAKFSINFGGKIASEGLEEAVQEVLTPLFENIALGYNKNGFEDIDWSNVAYSGLLGALSAGLLEGVPTARNIALESSVAKNKYKTIESMRALVNQGLSFSTDSDIYKTAQKYNKLLDSNIKLSGTQLSNLEKKIENMSKNKRLTQYDLYAYMRVGRTQRTRNKKIRMLESGKNPILTSKSEIKNFILNIIHGKALGEVRAYGIVGNRLAEAIKRKRSNLDLEGKYLELNADDLRESYKRHSTPKEKGDIPLTENDFVNIPEYIDNFDYVLAVNEYKGKIEIHLAKESEDGYIKILTVSSKERESLQATKIIGVSKEKFIQKYGKKIERDTGSLRGLSEKTENSNPSTTAQLTAGTLSTNTVSQNYTNVNNNIYAKAENNSQISRLRLNDDRYSDIINSRGEDNGLSDERGFYQNQRGMQETRHQNSGRNSQMGRTWRETQEAFTERTNGNLQEAGRRGRVLLRHNNSLLAYTPSDNGSNAVKMLKNAGVGAVFCDGDIETNQNDITTKHSEAITAPDGTVYVSSNASLSDMEIALHEAVHSNMYRKTNEYAEYEAVICDNILYGSKQCEKIFTRINDNHYGGKYDVNDPKDAAKFIRELAAYINQYAVTDIDYAQELFADMFDDWQSVVDAARTFNKDIGADFSESAFSLPENRETLPEGVRSEAVSLESEGKKRRHLNKAEQEYVKNLANTFGVNVIFENVKETTGIAGDSYYDGNGNIYMDFSVIDPINVLIKHELTHFGEESSTYSDFVNLVKNSNIFKDWINSKISGERDIRAKSEQYSQDIAERYRKAGKYLTVQEADDEMIANFVADTLFTDSGSGIDALINQASAEVRPALIQWVIDFLRSVKSLFKGQYIPPEVLRLERKYAGMLKDAQGTERQKNTAVGAVKFSIAVDDSGKYVDITTDQNLFDDKSIQEMQNIAGGIIRDRFKGKVLSVGGKGKAYINKRSAEEYAYPANRRMNTDIKASKMKASTELDNLLLVSEFIENQPDDGRHLDATGGWDVYLTRFKIDGNMFTGEVKIKVTDRGNVFYDITKIERLPVNSGLAETSSAAASGNLSINNISHSST